MLQYFHETSFHFFFALFSLVDTLPPHLEASNLDPSLDLDELPEDITLAQTASTWKYITLAQTASTWKYIIQFQAQQKQH
jgi:hypothetical protein